MSFPAFEMALFHIRNAEFNIKNAVIQRLCFKREKNNKKIAEICGKRVF
jgi:hypothetical protein